MSIELRGINKCFGEIQALQDVTLTFEENRIYGLLGSNGAGKSTLMRVLTGRLTADSGTVFIDGEPGGNDAALGKLFLESEENMFPSEMRVKKAFDTVGMFYPEFDREYALSLAEKFGLRLKGKIPPSPPAMPPFSV